MCRRRLTASSAQNTLTLLPPFATTLARSPTLAFSLCALPRPVSAPLTLISTGNCSIISGVTLPASLVFTSASLKWAIAFAIPASSSEKSYGSSSASRLRVALLSGMCFSSLCVRESSLGDFRFDLGDPEDFFRSVEVLENARVCEGPRLDGAEERCRIRVRHWKHRDCGTLRCGRDATRNWCINWKMPSLFRGDILKVANSKAVSEIS